MKKTIVLLSMFFLIPCAQAVAGLDMARSIVCSKFPMAVSVALQGGSKNPGDFFSGNATYNYEQVSFLSSKCHASATEVTCSGQWSGGEAAYLQIDTQTDGNYKGNLSFGNQTITMGCLPSYNPLN